MYTSAEIHVHGPLFCRKHHIPDGPVHSRAQPRRPDYLRSLNMSRHCDSELTPRWGIPQPPTTPPVMHGRHQQQHRTEQRRNEGLVDTHSFTFLPSTCSERSSLGPQTQPTAQDHLRVHPPHHPTLRPSLLTPTLTDPSRAAVRRMSQHSLQPAPVLLPPSAFQTHRTEAPPSPVDPSQSGTKCSTTPVLTSAPVGEKEAVCGPGQSPTASMEETAATCTGTVHLVAAGGAPNLDDPVVRSQIVNVRDKLKRYHDMRVRLKTLEEQVAPHTRENSSGQLASSAEVKCGCHECSLSSYSVCTHTHTPCSCRRN